jgi:hypothetical protein
MKDLELMGNILSGTGYRVSLEGRGLMDETNSPARQLVHKATRTKCNRFQNVYIVVAHYKINNKRSLYVRLRAICRLAKIKKEPHERLFFWF